jgi:hypothetical protein
MAGPSSNPDSAYEGGFPFERTSNEEKGERRRRLVMNECMNMIMNVWKDKIDKRVAAAPKSLENTNGKSHLAILI